MQQISIPQIDNCLKKLPQEKLLVVYDFVSDLLKRNEDIGEGNSSVHQTMLASEATLRRDWERPEEDEAWKDL